MAVRISSNIASQISAARPESGAAAASRRAAQVRQEEGRQRAQETRLSTEITQRTVARAQAREVEGQVREKVLERVDALVQSMEALAERIASDKVSSSQRSVLVSRFNDLQRKVNRIDGIVGSEGREARGQEALAQPGGQIEREAAARQERRPSVDQVRATRQRIQAERQQVAVERRETQQMIEQEMQKLQADAGTPQPEVVRTTASGIRDRGGEAVETASSGGLVDLEI